MIRLFGAMVALVLVALAAGVSAAGAPAAGFGVDETLSNADSSAPVLAFAPNGFGAVAWVENVGGGQSAVRVAVRPPGGPWSAPQLLGASTTSKTRLGVAIDAAGQVALTWQEFTSPSTYRVAVSTRPAGGAFGAPELLTDGTQTTTPAIGIDGAGQVTLVYNPTPNVSVRTFAVGSSALAASPQQLATGCGSIFDNELAVAPSGDAVAGFSCNGAVFALRRGGTWTVSPPVSDIVGAQCPSSPSASTFNRPLDVAIDAQGDPVGLLQTDTEQPDFFCPPIFGSTTTLAERLVLPLAGVMTPVGGTPAATGTQPPFIFAPPILGPDVGIGGGGIVFSWAANTSSFSYQPKVRLFGVDGSPVGAEQLVGPVVPSGPIQSQVAVGGDGRALLTWTQSSGAQTSVVAAERPPGGAFADPVAVSAGGDAVVASRAALDDTSDGAVSFLQGATTHLVHVRAFDVTPPALGAVSIPAAATAGKPAAFAASASDFWGPVTLAWSFGDGATAGGGALSHTFAHAGTFTVTVTATDAAGNAASRSGTVHVSAAAASLGAPVISRASLTNARFRVGAGPTAVSALARAGGAAAPAAADAAAARVRRTRVPIGTTFRFTLSAAATVTIAIERPVSGRLSGKRCVKPTHRLRSHRRCTRFLRVGTLKRHLRAGPARVPFSGRIGRKPLTPASYRATLTPRASGLTGTPRRLSFRVVR